MRPLILAHRGANQTAPQNTLPAFEEAIRRGADGVEFDVRMTSDGRLVVCHNPTVDTTSNGTGRIEAMPLAELRSLDFGSWFDPAFRGTRIPLLEEVLDLVRDLEMINIELKRPRTPLRQEVVEKTILTAEAFHLEDRVIYSSFDLPTLAAVKSFRPRARTGILYSFHTAKEQGMQRGGAFRQARTLRADALHPSPNYVINPMYLARCRTAGLEINTWGVRSEQEMRIAKKLPLHSIITDYIDV